MFRHNSFRDSQLRVGGKYERLMIASTVLLILGAAPAGCGDGDSIGHPSGQNELVLQVTTGGGLVPIDYDLTLVPEFSLYGDGRLIVPGPVMAIYPGPALPNLQTTVIPEGAGGLTTDQERARAAVGDLVGKLPVLSAFVSGEITWDQYQYSALAIYIQAVDPGSTPDPSVQPNRLEWPLGDLSTLGEEVPQGGFRRVVVSGQDLEALRPLLEQATEIVLWKSGGSEYRLMFRPLLPDESA